MKKVIFIILLLLLSGCGTSNIEDEYINDTDNTNENSKIIIEEEVEIIWKEEFIDIVKINKEDKEFNFDNKIINKLVENTTCDNYDGLEQIIYENKIKIGKVKCNGINKNVEEIYITKTKVLNEDIYLKKDYTYNLINKSVTVKSYYVISNYEISLEYYENINKYKEIDFTTINVENNIFQYSYKMVDDELIYDPDQPLFDATYIKKVDDRLFVSKFNDFGCHFDISLVEQVFDSNSNITEINTNRALNINIRNMDSLKKVHGDAKLDLYEQVLFSYLDNDFNNKIIYRKYDYDMEAQQLMWKEEHKDFDYYNKEMISVLVEK